MSGLLNSFSNNILLSNLINIRWIAIIGQIITILFVNFFLNIQIPIVLCLIVVLISVLVNIKSFYIKKINNYLSDKEAFYFLLFDTFQLAILLFLTGGIYNPFSFLIVAPIIISASYLRVTFSIILSSLSIIIVVFISFFYIQIEWQEIFVIPKLFTYGLALSLIISLIFIAVYVYIFANSSRGISKALNETRSALANQQKLSEVGSLSAAAVHELSTPLNTIFLILDDLKKNQIMINDIEIKEEIELLQSQAERCREILLRLSKNPENLKDDFLEKTTVSNIVKMIFAKYKNTNVKLKINILSSDPEPKIIYQDEIMYGIGNIIQNAVQHAVKNIVVNIKWNLSNIFIYIKDDGQGFSSDLLDKIGNPYISGHNNLKKGMGLGIFIAKNLIENINGKIFFQNDAKTNSSIVEIQLIRDNKKT